MQLYVVNHTILLLILSVESEKVIYLFQKASKHNIPLFAVQIILHMYITLI